MEIEGAWLFVVVLGFPMVGVALRGLFQHLGEGSTQRCEQSTAAPCGIEREDNP